MKNENKLNTREENEKVFERIFNENEDLLEDTEPFSLKDNKFLIITTFILISIILFVFVFSKSTYIVRNNINDNTTKILTRSKDPEKIVRDLKEVNRDYFIRDREFKVELENTNLTIIYELEIKAKDYLTDNEISEKTYHFPENTTLKDKKNLLTKHLKPKHKGNLDFNFYVVNDEYTGIVGDNYEFNEGDIVTIETIETVDTIENIPTDYKTEYVTDTGLSFKETKVLSKGDYGLVKRTTRTTYVDNIKKGKPEVVDNTILNKPKTEKIAIGNSQTIKENISYGKTYKRTNDLKLGEYRVERKGQVGLKETTYIYDVLNENNPNKVLKQTTRIIREPINEVILQGTKIEIIPKPPVEPPVEDNNNNNNEENITNTENENNENQTESIPSDKDN